MSNPQNQSKNPQEAQKNAYLALFDPNQKIIFQNALNQRRPFIGNFPFGKNDMPFIVLNPFDGKEVARLKTTVPVRQSFTVEMDCGGLTTQQEVFQRIFGESTVSVFSGGKSIHHHVRLKEPLTEEEEKKLVVLLKKALPLADWKVIDNRHGLVRNPGGIRDTGAGQEILFVGKRREKQEIFAVLEKYTANIKNIATQANNFVQDVRNNKIKPQDLSAATQNAVKNLLLCGYSLAEGKAELYILREIKEIKEIAIGDMIEQERDAVQIAELKIPKPQSTGDLPQWIKDIEAKMSGNWEAFFTKYGIHKTRKAGDEWMKGFTAGEHKNPAPGFAFNKNDGAWHSWYSGKGGYPLAFLVEEQKMTKEAAWKALGEMAGVEIPEQGQKKCIGCQETIMFSADRKPINLDGTPHKCQDKKAALFQVEKKAANTKQVPFNKEEIIKTIPADFGNYIVVPSGVFTETVKWNEDRTDAYNKYEKICEDAVLVSERYEDIYGEECYVKLTWGNREKIFPQPALMNKNFEVLVKSGVRILGPNTLDMAGYFLASVGAAGINKDFTTRYGWHKSGKFVYGNIIIAKDGKETPIQRKEEAPLVGVLGDAELWKNAIAGHTNDPQVQIALAAAAVGPILEPMGFTEGFTLHFYQDSSVGKSFALKLAASFWGCFANDNGVGVLRSWYGSIAGHEMYFHLMKNVTCFLDESQLAETDRIAERTAYNFANGFGKSRGQKTLEPDKLLNWRTSMLSTGEKKLTDASMYGGITARVIEVYRKPIGEIAQSLFRDTLQAITKNYGHGGREFIKYFLAHQDWFEKWYRYYLSLLEKKVKETKEKQGITSFVFERLMDKWAIILVGAKLNNFLFKFEFSEEQIISEMEKSLFATEGEKPSESLHKFLIDCYASNKKRFHEKRMAFANNQPVGYQIFEISQSEEVWGFFSLENHAIYFLSKPLREQIKKAGYSWSQLNMLKEQGLLLCANKRGNRIAHKWGGQVMDFIGILLDKPEPKKEPLPPEIELPEFRE